MNRTLLGATILVQSGRGSDGNKGILCIPQSSRITEGLPSDCLVSYPGHSAEKQSVYSTAPADCVNYKQVNISYLVAVSVFYVQT